MSPLLKDGDELRYVVPKKLVAKRNDLVVISFSHRDRAIVKRVYGEPGDSFSLKYENENCKLFINDSEVKNSVGISFSFQTKACKMFSIYIIDYKNKIPKNAHLVLGDDPSGSLDSSKFGLIDTKNILGVVQKVAPTRAQELPEKKD